MNTLNTTHLHRVPDEGTVDGVRRTAPNHLDVVPRGINCARETAIARDFDSLIAKRLRAGLRINPVNLQVQWGIRVNHPISGDVSASSNEDSNVNSFINNQP